MHFPIGCGTNLNMGRRTTTDERYSEQEAQQRFETALRGARSVGHKQMKDISPKRPKARRSKQARKHD